MSLWLVLELRMWGREGSLRNCWNLAWFLKDTTQSLHFSLKTFYTLRFNSKSKFLCISLIDVLLSSKGVSGFQPPCLGWKELLFRYLLACRQCRDLWELLTEVGVMFIGLHSQTPRKFREKEERNLVEWLPDSRMCYIFGGELRSIASLLILPR